MYVESQPKELDGSVTNIPQAVTVGLICVLHQQLTVLGMPSPLRRINTNAPHCFGLFLHYMETNPFCYKITSGKLK